jgi:hypothetical protein
VTIADGSVRTIRINPQNRIRLKGLASLKPTKERAFRQNGRDRAKVDEAVRDGVRLGPLRPAGY